MNRREALAALISLPEVARISVARVKPTDVIVIECADHYISPEAAQRIEASMKNIWPDQKIVIFDKSLRMKVVEG